MNEFENFDEQSMRTMRGDTTEGSLGRIDQYDIIRKLGGGGFGVVYLVRDTLSNVEYAIKTLHPLLKSNLEEMENLRNQFSLVSKLIHSHIAPAMILHPIKEVVYTTEEVRKELRLTNGDFVMVMKYAPGVTLSKWRKQFPNGIVPIATAIDICKQIASALDYAHLEKIIHRDIKPGNIMIETDSAGKPIARVLDFGLAAEIRSSMSRVSTTKGDTSGTRPYMAPEQWQGIKQGPATDQYALACLFYELVSGAVPFAGVFETGDSILMRETVKTEKSQWVTELSRSQNMVLMRALAKDPKKRWSTCSEFVNKLEANQATSKPKLFLSILVLLFIGIAFLYFRKSKDETIKPINQEPVTIEESQEPVTIEESQEPVTIEESQESIIEDVPEQIEQIEQSIAPNIDDSVSEEEVSEKISDTAEQQVEILQPLQQQPVEEKQILVLPSKDATIEEYKAFISTCKDEIDELKAQGYLDSDEKVKSIVDLQDQAQKILKGKQQIEERKKRAEDKTKSKSEKQRKISLENIKKAIKANLETLDTTWNDGVFAEKRKIIQEKTSELQSYESAADLEKAQAARTIIEDAIIWITENTPNRDKISQIETKIGNLQLEIELSEVKILELKLYNKAQNLEKEGKSALNEGELTKAESKLDEAFTTYESAILSAKCQKSTEKLKEAEYYKKNQMWEDCIKLAQESLEWNPDNEDAKTLLENANEQLIPTITILGYINGENISAQDVVEIGGRKYDFGDEIEVVEGRNYGDIAIDCKINGTNYFQTVSIGKVNWKGEKTFKIQLKKQNEPQSIKVANIEMVRIPNSAEHKGLYFGKYEVTQAQWQAIMGNNPSFYTGDLNRPVEQVSWNDCQNFIDELNSRSDVKRLKIEFFLPTAEQWKYACRAGSKGDVGLLADGQEGTIDEMGWYWDNSNNKTHPVGQKMPNAWGLYDMHGNVGEWTASVSKDGWRYIRCGGCCYSLEPGCLIDDKNLSMDASDKTGSSLGLRLACRIRTVESSGVNKKK